MGNRAGQQLGKYHLIQLLGAGAFAEVYLGEHIHLKTLKAVKVLHTVLADDNTEGFLREAQIIASLNHPHIVRVLDFEIENHTPFLIMDYFTQGNMRRPYPKGSQIPLASVASYLKQIASALQYAHEQKIIHRDIKPENILVDQQHALAISDFGTALMSQSSRHHTTQEIAGTAAYMAPEQLQGHPQRASDQYALGIVVYEWLAGDIPFHGSFTEIASQHLFIPPPALATKVPNLPEEVEQVVLKALAKDPQQRFANVQAFASAFEQAYIAAPANRATVQSQQSTQTLITPPMPNDMPIRHFPGIQQAKVIIAGRTPKTTNSATTSPIPSPHTTTLLPKGTPKPSQHLSRRVVLASLGGVAGLGIGTLAITWAASTRTDGTSNTHTPTPKGATTTANSSTPSTGNRTLTAFITYTSSGDIWAAAWSPDGKYIALSGNDPIIHVWDPKTGKDVFTYKGHTGKGRGTAVVALAWSPTGDRIVSVSTTTDINGNRPDVQVWNVKSRKLITSYTGHNPAPGYENIVGSVSWSPDGTRIASAGVYDGTTRLWSAQTGVTIYTYQSQAPHPVWKAAWSPNGNFIASASFGSVVNGAFRPTGGGNVQVWTIDGTLVNTYNDFTDQGDIAWSPNSQYIISSGSDNQMHLWNASTDIVERRFADPYHVAWSPNGRQIAAVEFDTTLQNTSMIQLFDTSTGTSLATLTGNTSPINVVAWSPDGTTVLSGSGRGKNVALLWKV
jgi:eukaryotic-like serine/threonine-protein kinase